MAGDYSEASLGRKAVFQLGTVTSRDMSRLASAKSFSTLHGNLRRTHPKMAGREAHEQAFQDAITGYHEQKREKLNPQKSVKLKAKRGGVFPASRHILDVGKN